MKLVSFFIISIFCLLIVANSNISQVQAAVRGTSGDLWADIVLGQRDFGEVAAREVVNYKISAPGGVIVDTATTPGKMYVWDGGNNRILGMDLAKCYSQNGPCAADIVLGQPSGNDYGSCNQDASFVNYPYRKLASANTLCGIREGTQTTLEDKSWVSMEVDANGALFVPDFFNNRLLKFNNPFSTDTVADEVWGQADFSGVYCNKNAYKFKEAESAPTASSLCFSHTFGDGAGVAFDLSGNMWVADGGNHRVLRFPKTSTSFSKTADLVLGQTNFTSLNHGTTMNKFNSPSSVAFDKDGNLYVADRGNNRVLKFVGPFTNGQTASQTFGTYNELANIQATKDRQFLVSNENQGYDNYSKIWNLNGTVKAQTPPITNRTLGSVGIDNDGKILRSTYVYGHDVHVYTPQTDGTYLHTKNLFSPPFGYNITSDKRLEHPAWVGILTVGNQLIVTDGRLLFWNDYKNLTNGKPFDGFVGETSITKVPEGPGYNNLAVDNQNRIWTTRGGKIEIYQAPLVTGQLPLKTITSIPVLGGGTISFGWNEFLSGIAITPDAKYMWLSQPDKHRIFRVRNPFTTPEVDIILGQSSLAGISCNRGQYPERDPRITLNMLCAPGKIAFDKKGNLFVSDHVIEGSGNVRMLMFAPALFPDNLTQVLYGPNATKEFPMQSQTNSQSHATFGPAFDSTNRMVVGYNPYFGPRFVEYYNDPTKLNPSNPRDPAYALPDGQLNDFESWVYQATFDPEDNLYIYDPNLGQVRIYKKPFSSSSPITAGDANGDGLVNGVDYVVWLTNFNQDKSGPTFGDFDNSGKVDGVDYVIWLNAFLLE